MSLGRIALLGSAPYLERVLLPLLQESRYDVSLHRDGIIGQTDLLRFKDYDLLIISSALLQHLEEDSLLSYLLSLNGFLFVDDDARSSPERSRISFYIHPQMSPEEVIGRVNDVVFKSKSLRRSPRVKVNLEVQYKHEGQTYRSEITNLSLNGLFISTLNPLAQGTLIPLRFWLPTGKEIQATGRVLYAIALNLQQGIIAHPGTQDQKIVAIPGMGIFFETIPPEDREALKQFIEGLLESP